MRRLKPIVLLCGLIPMLSACGLPGAVAGGVKSIQRSFGGGQEPPPAQPAPPPPARTATEPPPPQPVQRDSVKVEELR